MKIFISHSLKNKELLSSIEKDLTPLGFQLLIAEHLISATDTITQKVERMMDVCDMALVLLTEDGFNSASVQQEVGYLHKLSKPRLLLVQAGLEKRLSMFNYGRDHLILDPNDMNLSITQLRKWLLDHWIERIKMQQAMQQMAESRRRAAEEKKQKEAQQGFALLAGIVLLAMASK
ncbi:MAG: TIR domain-containing protein [Flavobacteriales bacterium]|nr:TIR domain-containing protein [Flavobacteriales bacterium]